MIMHFTEIPRLPIHIWYGAKTLVLP